MSKFKAGDHVQFIYGKTVDYGTIVREHESKDAHWWVKWESSGNTEHAEEEYLTLVKHETAPTGKSYEDLIKEAAHKAISNGDYAVAIRTLKLLLNEQYD